MYSIAEKCMMSIAACLILSCVPARACGGAIYVEILCPKPGAAYQALRGSAAVVGVRAWTTGGLKVATIKVLYNDVEKLSYALNPSSESYCYVGSFCSFEMANTNGTLKAKAFAENDPSYAVDTKTVPDRQRIPDIR